MRMRWFLPNPIKTLPTLNKISSISFRSFVPHSLCFTSRSSVRNRFQMAAIHNHSEAGLAKRFWIKFNRESIFAMYTPFVISLASGNLKIDSFRHYIAQDVHFLRAFAQAYESAEDCADDDDDKLGLSQLRKAVLEELKMHRTLVELKDELSKENLQLAEENLQKEPRMMELRNQCRIIRTTELATANEKLNELEKQKEEMLKLNSPASLLQRIQGELFKTKEAQRRQQIMMNGHNVLDSLLLF